MLSKKFRLRALTLMAAAAWWMVKDWPQSHAAVSGRPLLAVR